MVYRRSVTALDWSREADRVKSVSRTNQPTGVGPWDKKVFNFFDQCRPSLQQADCKWWDQIPKVQLSRAAGHLMQLTPPVASETHSIAPDKKSTSNVHFDSSAVCRHSKADWLYLPNIYFSTELCIITCNFLVFKQFSLGHGPVKVWVAFANLKRSH